MDKQRIQQYKTSFDSIARYINNENDSEHVEVWFARDLQSILGYVRWENFIVAIQRAVDSCKTHSKWFIVVGIFAISFSLHFTSF